MKPLCLNLDETSIRVYQDAGRGFVTAVARKRKATGRGLHRKVPTAATRAAFTQVGLICNDAAIQPLLPQVLCVNAASMSVPTCLRLQRELPRNILLWRRTSAWMDIGCICQILNLVAKHLKEARAFRQLILCLDAARIHLNEKVWRTAARHGIMLLPIPAKLTWVLQPLDTHVFAQYKDRLKIVSQELAISAEDPAVTIEGVIEAVRRCVDDVINGSPWSKAFRDLGLSGTQEGVSQRVLRKLDLAHAPYAGHAVPTLVDLQRIFPARSIIPIDAVFATVTSIIRRAAAGAPQSLPPQGAISVGSETWVGRPGSSSSRLRVEPEAVPPPPLPPPDTLPRPERWLPRLQLRRLPSAPAFPQRSRSSQDHR